MMKFPKYMESHNPFMFQSTKQLLFGLVNHGEMFKMIPTS